MTGSRKKNKTRHPSQRLPVHLRTSRALQARDEARRIRKANSARQLEQDNFFEQLSDWSRHLEAKEALLCQRCSVGTHQRCRCHPLSETSQSHSSEESPLITTWRDANGILAEAIGWSLNDDYTESVGGEIESASDGSDDSTEGWGWSMLGLRRDGRM